METEGEKREELRRDLLENYEYLVETYRAMALPISDFETVVDNAAASLGYNIASLDKEGY